MKKHLLLFIFFSILFYKSYSQGFILQKDKHCLIYCKIDSIIECETKYDSTYQIIVLSDITNISNDFQINSDKIELIIYKSAVTYYMSCPPYSFDTSQIGDYIFTSISEKDGKYYLPKKTKFSIFFFDRQAFKEDIYIKLKENHTIDSLFFYFQKFFKTNNNPNKFDIIDNLIDVVKDEKQYDFIRESVFEELYLLEMSNISNYYLYVYFSKKLYTAFIECKFSSKFAKMSAGFLEYYCISDNFFLTLKYFHLLNEYDFKFFLELDFSNIKGIKALISSYAHVTTKSINDTIILEKNNLFILGKVKNIKNNKIKLEKIEVLDGKCNKKEITLYIENDTISKKENNETIYPNLLWLGKYVLVNLKNDNGKYYVNMNDNNLYKPPFTPNQKNIFLISNRNLKLHKIYLKESDFIDTIKSYYTLIKSNDTLLKENKLKYNIYNSKYKFIQIRSVWDFAEISDDLKWSFTTKYNTLANISKNSKLNWDIKVTADLVNLIYFGTVYNLDYPTNIYSLKYFMNNYYYRKCFIFGNEYTNKIITMILYDYISKIQQEIQILEKWKTIAENEKND